MAHSLFDLHGDDEVGPAGQALPWTGNRAGRSPSPAELKRELQQMGPAWCCLTCGGETPWTCLQEIRTVCGASVIVLGTPGFRSHGCTPKP